MPPAKSTESAQLPLPPGAGFLAPVPTPPRHKWQAGPTWEPTERMAWARDVPVRSPSERLLLLTLASFSDRWGVCWPSLGTLADRTMLDRRTVMRALKALQADARIGRDKRPPRSTVYLLMLDGG